MDVNTVRWKEVHFSFGATDSGSPVCCRFVQLYRFVVFAELALSLFIYTSCPLTSQRIKCFPVALQLSRAAGEASCAHEV